jgi:hypothetical protein
MAVIRGNEEKRERGNEDRGNEEMREMREMRK